MKHSTTYLHDTFVVVGGVDRSISDDTTVC
jgi:hypothetical protein